MNYDLSIALSLAIVLPALFKTLYHFTSDVHLLSDKKDWEDEF